MRYSNRQSVSNLYRRSKEHDKGTKDPCIRTHPELVKRLFESEVTEVKDGTVEIKSIASEAGSRTKIAVWSNDPMLIRSEHVLV